MTKQISIKFKLGWISVFENGGKIFKVQFGKLNKQTPSNRIILVTFPAIMLTTNAIANNENIKGLERPNLSLIIVANKTPRMLAKLPQTSTLLIHSLSMPALRLASSI